MHFYRIKKEAFANFGIFDIFNKFVKLAFVLWILILSGSLPTYSREIKDTSNTLVQVPDHPQRIVTLAPSLGELAADLLGENLNKIVGISEHTDYPPGLKKITSIGPYHQFNLEAVLALKPDLVLATKDGNPKDRVLQLREFGIPVIVIQTESFQQIEESIRIVSLSLGVNQLGEQMILRLHQGIKKIQERSKPHSLLRVLLQVGDEPVTVVGKGSFLDEALKTVGAKNIYSDATIHYPHPSTEDIIQRNPDVIVILALGDTLQKSQQAAKKWYQFPSLKATQTHRIQILQSDTLLRPTLRLLEGLSLLEQAIYGKK